MTRRRMFYGQEIVTVIRLGWLTGTIRDRHGYIIRVARWRLRQLPPWDDRAKFSA